MKTLPQIHISKRLLLASGAMLVLIALLVAGFTEQGRVGQAPVIDRGPTGPQRSAAQPSEPAARAVQKSEADAGAVQSDVIGPEPIPPIDDGIAPGERNRRVERSAELRLAVRAGQIEKGAGGVSEVTARHRGFVVSSDVTTGEEGATGGRFDLRVPASELHDTMRDLAGLGHVRSRTESGNDVTKGFVSTGDRLDTARAERRSLLRRLAGAKDDKQARVLRQRVNLASANVRSLQSQLRDLRERTDYAAVRVSLEREGHDSSTGGVHKGLDDLTGSLVESANIALRALGILIPVSLLLGLSWLLWRRTRRER